MKRRETQDSIRLLVIILYFVFFAPGLFMRAGRPNPGLILPEGVATSLVMVLLFLLVELLEYVRWSYHHEKRRIPGILFIIRLILAALPSVLDKGGPEGHLFSRFTIMLIALLPFYALFAFPRTVSLTILAFTAFVPSATELLFTGESFSEVSLMFSTYLTVMTLIFYVLAWFLDTEKKRSRENLRLLEELQTSETRLRDYAGRVAHTVALEERTRLARDIHDSVGHALTAVGIQLKKAEAYRELDPDESFSAIRAARETAADAMADVRDALGRLNDEETIFSFNGLVPKLVAPLKDAGIDVEYNFHGDETGYNYSVLMGLYRFVQEGITNIMKHSGAGHVRLEARFNRDGATVVLSDDGKGFVPEGEKGSGDSESYGLTGLSRRLELVRGTLRIESQPGEGCHLTALVPRDPVALLGEAIR